YADVEPHELIGPAVKPQRHWAALLGDANPRNDMPDPSHSCCDPTRQVGVEQESLQDLGPESPQLARQPPQHANRLRAPGAETDAGARRAFQCVSQRPAAREAEDCRIPAAAVEPRYELSEGPLGPTGIQVGDAERDADSYRGVGH